MASTTKVIEILSRVRTLLQDDTDGDGLKGIRWTTAELCGWLDDAYRELAVLDPDSFVTKTTFSVTASSVFQKLPDGVIKLVDIIKATGRVRKIERAVLDDQLPGWYSASATANPEYYMYDPRTPEHFLLYPKPSSALTLTLAYVKVDSGGTTVPTTVSDAGAVAPIKVDDKYVSTLVNYMLYRCYLKDAEYAANSDRAIGYYNALQASLQAKLKVDDSTQTTNKEPGFSSSKK